MFTGLESPVHILMLLVLALLLFGAKRLPEIGRSLGSGMREFKESISGAQVDTDTVSAPTSVLAVSSEGVPADPSGAARPTDTI